MSWGVCNSGSNNTHFDFPPIMSDGRNYANWLPGAEINEQIRLENNIKTNNDYRKYLTNNADNIIKYNQLSACDECCSTLQTFNNDNTTHTPFLYKSCLDDSKPFGYETSDLKEVYLTEQQLQSRTVTPVISQDKLLLNGYYKHN
jgi:hypothetical protein